MHHILTIFSSAAWRLYALALFATFFSVADQPLGRDGNLPLSPTLTALIALLPFGCHTLVQCIRSQALAPLIRPLQRNRGPLLSFAATVVFSLLLSVLPGAYWKEGGKWIFLIPYGLLMTLLSLYVASVSAVRSWLPLYVLCALGLLLWSLSIDLSTPGTYAELDARAAGFPGNANFSALVTVMLCAATLDFQRRTRGWFDLLLLTITTTIVLGTMSRSGLINLCILMAVYFYYRLIASRGSTPEAVRLCAVLIAIATTLFLVVPLFTRSMPALKQSTRISRFLNNQQVDDGSAGTRLAAVEDCLRRIDAAPLLGHGTGHARSMPELPHNLYLQQWVNNGLPGLLSYLALLGLSYNTFRRRGNRNGVAFILVTTVGSAFSHNVLDQRPFLMLLGILLGSASEEMSLPYPRPATER